MGNSEEEKCIRGNREWRRNKEFEEEIDNNKYYYYLVIISSGL